MDLGDLLPVGVLAELAEVDLLVALLAEPVEAALLEQEEGHRLQVLPWGRPAITQEPRFGRLLSLIPKHIFHLLPSSLARQHLKTKVQSVYQVV